ncbi:stage V sporulation protein B [Paenibacillus alkalitolerans]|uniref:stage V sporulation protein B n=1 Tax=Paenibacillus alkalitolerans TaxID=2799335 RepID=UPI0018F5F5C1|nr:stage V sporulation protein B [Paenibacillus alkalitolerans]
MQKQSFARGAFILTAAALVTRIIGFINGIVLARLLGAEGIGLLMMAYPLIPLIITLTELGLPVAISKLVAEADAQGNQAKVKKILAVSLAVTCTLSIALTATALLGAKPIASFLLTDQRAYYAMLALIPIAPVVAVSAVLKGYFRGKQNMKSIAFSDVIENTIQIVCIVALVQFLIPYGIQYAAAGAMTAAVLGEAAGLLFLITRFRMYRQNSGVREKLSRHLQQGKQTLSELLHIGLPTTGHGLISSVYSAFQPMLITKSLAVAGIGTALATKQFGLMAGYAFPLLFLPSFITHSLSTALIPAVSEANASRNEILMHRRMDQALRIGLIVGAPATVILYIWATPLTTLVYHAPEAGVLLKILAPFFFLHYFEAPLHAVLLGMGRANATMWNFIVATAFKAMAIMIFGTEFGINGVALGIGLGICLLALLNFFSTARIIGFYLDARQTMKVIFSALLMAICGQFAFSFSQRSGFDLLWAVIASISAALLVYCMALAVSGAMKRKRSPQIRKAPFQI